MLHNVFYLIYDVFPVAVLNRLQGSGAILPLGPAFIQQRLCSFLTMKGSSPGVSIRGVVETTKHLADSLFSK